MPLRPKYNSHTCKEAEASRRSTRAHLHIRTRVHCGRYNVGPFNVILIISISATRSCRSNVYRGIRVQIATTLYIHTRLQSLPAPFFFCSHSLSVYRCCTMPSQPRGTCKFLVVFFPPPYTFTHCRFDPEKFGCSLKAMCRTL